MQLFLNYRQGNYKNQRKKKNKLELKLNNYSFRSNVLNREFKDGNKN